MSFKFHYKCVSPDCGNVFHTELPMYRCKCGSVLIIERDLDYVKKSFSSAKDLLGYTRNLPKRKYPNDSVWRWREFLIPGFPDEHIVSHREGNNDIASLPDELVKTLGMQMHILRDGQNPTGSFKDRGMSMLISYGCYLQAVHPEAGVIGVICASTGDTAASAAGYAGTTAGKLKGVILMPEGQASEVQEYQCKRSGALILLVQQNGFSQLMALLNEYCASDFKFLLANSLNPMRLPLQSTILLEFFDHFDGKMPDWLIVPTGNAGDISAQMHVALDMYTLGIIPKLPGFIIAQSENANTLVRWVTSGFTKYEPGDPNTISVASAACIQDPVSYPRMEYFRQQSCRLHGFTASEQEIDDARARFSQHILDVCPHTAMAIVAAMKARESELIKEGDTVGIVSTASDMKFALTGSAYHAGDHEYSNQPVVIKPTLDAIRHAVANRY